MARTAVLVGAAALLALGGYAALPDDEPQYLGDMPSMLADSGQAASGPAPFTPPPDTADRPHVDGPDPVVEEVPAGPGPAVPAERVPAPITDSPRKYSPGSAGGSNSGGTFPLPSISDLLNGLPLDGVLLCIDTDTIFRPGLGTIDCVTGQVLVPDPAIPVPTLPVPTPTPVPNLPVEPPTTGG